VYDYFGTDRDRNDTLFAILPAAPIVGAGPVKAGAEPYLIQSASGGRISMWVNLPGSFRAVLTDLRGRAAASAERRGPGALGLSTASLPRGVYRLTLYGRGVRATRKVTLLD
jgi:hypothetical protein